jgi:hypothetical protein
VIEVSGDIWTYHAAGRWIVIPTNGNIKSNKEAVMGKGLTLQAKVIFPKLPIELAYQVQAFGAGTFVLSTYRLFALSTKYHWRDKSDLQLIEDNIIKLLSLTSMVSIKYPGVLSG